MYEKIIQFVLPDLRAYRKRPAKMRALSFNAFMNDFVFELNQSSNILYPHLFSEPKFDLLEGLNRIYIPFKLVSRNDYRIISSANIYTNFVKEESIESMLSTIRDTLDEEQIQNSRILWDDGSFVYLESFVYDSKSDMNHNIAIIIIGDEVEVYIHNYWYEERYYKISLQLTSGMKLPTFTEYYRLGNTIILESVISKNCAPKRSLFTYKNYGSDLKLDEEIQTAVIKVYPSDYIICYKKESNIEILAFWLVTHIEGNIAHLFLQRQLINGVWDSPIVPEKFLHFEQRLRYTVNLIEEKFGNLPFDFTLF